MMPARQRKGLERSPHKAQAMPLAAAVANGGRLH